MEDVAGIDRFIKIVKVLNDQNKNINALIIGSGSRMKDLKKLTKKLSLDHIIKFKGQIPEEDVLDYYNKIDIAVFHQELRVLVYLNLKQCLWAFL